MNQIEAYRIDIKGFTEELYERLTGSRVLGSVLRNALIAREAGAHVEVVTNVIPNWNDSDAELAGLSKWIAGHLGLDTPWHVTAYYPAHQVSEPPTPASTLERARAIGTENGLRYVYIGNIPGHSGQNTLCPECGRTLIDRNGFRVKKLHVVSGKCEYCGHGIGGLFDDGFPFQKRERTKK
jgi:pyruvate formate lyase activating enzyme